MKHDRATLLAGIAALTLIAGTGLASAQESSKSGADQGATSHATQPMNKAPASGTMSRGAQQQERGSLPKQQSQRTDQGNSAEKTDKNLPGENRAQTHEQNRSAQSNTDKAPESHAGKAALDRDRNRNAAENERLNRGNTAAEQQNRSGAGTKMNAERGRTGMEGLQGNASGLNVRLSERQRNEIRTTVINASGAPRVGHVDFDVTVGTPIPRGRVHVVPLPETLVRIEPEWRGFLYFVYGDEVVVVNPNNMRIVAVIAA
jgi:hypothetical protein